MRCTSRSSGPHSPARRCRSLPPPRRLARELAAHDGATIRVAGHLQEYRGLGGVAFALVRDRTGVVQVTLKKGVADPAFFGTLAALARESVVEVDGTVVRSPRANSGVELHPIALRVLSVAEVPLPLGIVDKVHVELDTRLDHRALDLRKPEVRGIFQVRAALLHGFRAAFRAREFLEVETPKLLRQGAEGGATLFRVAYFETEAFLAQSPQLYKQMLMGAGFERVFEIAPAFRAERSDTVRHLTEFTSLDAEMAYPEGAEGLRRTLEEILRDAVATARAELEGPEPALAERLPKVLTPFPTIAFAECRARLGVPERAGDLSTEEERRLGEIVAPEGQNPFYYITDFPSEVKRTTFYAARRPEAPELTGYFDLSFRGLELASGGPREHDLERLRANMAAAGLDPAGFPGYLETFRFGMPPHGGWGFGIDRFVQAILGLGNVRESRLFPRDQYRLDP
ncbi:MAG: aspartate--tRNA(Asn) ligase [Thermoplasmata archaeon]